MIYLTTKIKDLRFKIKDSSQTGVTLLLAILILASVLAISFSLATVMFIEVRSSGDLLKTEPALYAATGVGEQAFFNLERHVCTAISGDCPYTANFTNNVRMPTPPTILSTSTSIFIDKVKTGSIFTKTLNRYDFCGSTATSSGCSYGKVIVNYITTNGGADPLYAYLCEFDATGQTNYPNEPCTATSTSQGYWKAPDNSSLNSDGSFTMYQSPGNSSASWTLNPAYQQKLILTNPSGQADIYVKIQTFDTDGVTGKGLPYVGKTAVDINTQNASVGRRIQVVVPNSTISTNSGPVAYWRLDEMAGATSFADSSGNGNTGSCPSGLCPTMGVAGHVGTAASFNGSSNYISLARSSLNQQSQWTWSGWIYPSNDGYVYTEGIPQITFLLMMSGGAVHLGIWNQNQPSNWITANSSAGVITYNAWNHVAITMENGGVGTGTLKFYINGAFVSSAAGQTEDNASAQYALFGDNIGAYYGGGQEHSYFSGKLDDVHIYNRALSASEIAALAQ